MSQVGSGLASTGWLSRQDKSFQRSLLEGAILRNLEPGEAAYDLAADADGFFGLAEGFLDVLVGPGHATPVLVHVACPGWWFGEAALINDTPRRGHITARTSATLVFVPRHHITTLQKRDDETWRRIAGITVDQLDLALEIAMGYAQGEPGARIRAALARLFPAHAPEMEIPLSQSDLAEVAGLSRNAAGAALKGLEAAGIVEIGYRRLRVCSHEKLCGVVA